MKTLFIVAIDESYKFLFWSFSFEIVNMLKKIIQNLKGILIAYNVE
jgi:hypothetical protein